MARHGFVRVATACPILHIADCKFNVEQSLMLMMEASRQHVDVIVFPELGLTGYTCGDLFHHRMLIDSASDALLSLVKESQYVYSGLCIIGIPVEVDGLLFNCAAVFQSGKILGIIPKTFLPNYNEFYEARHFASSTVSRCDHINFAGRQIPFGIDLLFQACNVEGLILGVEICEDLWVPIPPSSYQAVAGATLLVNLSASNEILGKSEYRRQLVSNQSGRCVAGYVYSSSGYGESSTDIVYGGHGIIAENGTILAESHRFQKSGQLTIADLDLDHVLRDRMNMTTFHQHQHPSPSRSFRRISFTVEEIPVERPRSLSRTVSAYPFVPSEKASLHTVCNEIFHMQTVAMMQRLEHIGVPNVCIGVSGGLDSTLALIVTCKTFDMLGFCRSGIRTFIMPGFGTTARTKLNSLRLVASLGVSVTEVDICQLTFEQIRAIGHLPFGINIDHLDVPSFIEEIKKLPSQSRYDLTFENIQARIRTSLLMNAGFVIGTGDMSELALGWCTYNADHMSMYNPNVSIPKTLVKFLVKWLAETEFDGAIRGTLLDIVDTEISPELLPVADDAKPQSTEATIGPYELHDFFLYHFLRWGATPDKILFLAQHAKFSRNYSIHELKKWLKLFIRRFFANQYKRSCLPDGPKVGSVSVSPRGDWRMPSDAEARAWLDALEKIE